MQRLSESWSGCPSETGIPEGRRKENNSIIAGVSSRRSQSIVPRNQCRLSFLAYRVHHRLEEL